MQVRGDTSRKAVLLFLNKMLHLLVKSSICWQVPVSAGFAPGLQLSTTDLQQLQQLQQMLQQQQQQIQLQQVQQTSQNQSLNTATQQTTQATQQIQATPAVATLQGLQGLTAAAGPQIVLINTSQLGGALQPFILQNQVHMEVIYSRLEIFFF